MSYDFRELVRNFNDMEMSNIELEAICQHTIGPFREAIEKELQRRDELQSEKEYEDTECFYNNVGTLVPPMEAEDG